MKDNTTLFSLFGQFAHAQNYATAFSEMLDLFLIPFMWHETEVDFRNGLNRLQQHPKKDNLIQTITSSKGCNICCFPRVSAITVTLINVEPQG